MIKATDLRIANILLVDSGNFKGPLKIETFTNYTIHFDNGTVERIEDCYPIPLTEDILLQCGFVKDESFVVEGSPYYHYDLNDVCITMPYFDFCFNNSDIEIKYLHQLQNLYFALCGEELEIKL